MIKTQQIKCLFGFHDYDKKAHCIWCGHVSLILIPEGKRCLLKTCPGCGSNGLRRVVDRYEVSCVDCGKVFMDIRQATLWDRILRRNW